MLIQLAAPRAIPERAANPRAPLLSVAGSRAVLMLITLLTLGSGLLNIWSVVGRGLPERVEFLRRFLPLEAVHFTRSMALLAGLALVVSAANIWKRKRRAWMAVMVLAAASVVLHLLKGIDYEEASLSAVLLVALWLMRRQFTVRSRALNRKSAAAKVVLTAVLAVLYGAAGFWVLETTEFGRNFDWRESLKLTMQYLVFAGDDQLVPRSHYAEWFLDSLSVMSAATLLYAGWSLFRPVLYRFRTHPGDAAEARAIVAQYGRSGQDYFKSGLDKSFFFSPDRHAFLAYRVAAHAAVVLGDPVGPEEALEPLARSFLEYCRENGWKVLFHQTTPDFLPLYSRLGLRRIKIGDDAVVDLSAFSLSGRSAKPLRAKLNQFNKLGMQATYYPAPVPDSLLDRVKEVSDDWLQLPGRRERQFTLGHFDRDYLRTTPILTVEDASGRVLGYVNIIPSFRAGETTIDHMRRRTDAPNGVMDYLFLKLFVLSREQGFQRFSLGMAPMSGFQPDEEAAVEERLVHALFQRLNFVFAFEGLRAYKAKFASFWEPRYLVYQNPLDLPLAPLALAGVSELSPEEE